MKRNGYDGYIIKDAGETKDFDTVVFRKDKSPDLKAVEQSLKETTKDNTSNVEAGSVGVGGDVKIKYGGADKDLKGNPQKQWMKPAETS